MNFEHIQENITRLQGIIDSIRDLGLVNKTLNDLSWEEISNIAASGEATNYFSIGDCKEITINGSIGAGLTLSNYKTCVYIIGFDHNGATNTIDFGTFKTAINGGVDVALVDGMLNQTYSGLKYFNMNHDMSSNIGGWKECALRYDILGSTKMVGQDAVANTVTDPISNTLMAALPSDLRAVMKPMTIYTDNTGNKSNTSEDVTASIDYLPLLSEFEVIGNTVYSNYAERNYQKQYAYYSAGNSKVKYRHSATDSTAIWWWRSPACYNGTNFCTLEDDRKAGTSRGLAPIFRV